MTTAQAAQYLGIDQATLQKAAQRGQIAFGKSSNGARNYSPEQVRAYAKTHGIALPGDPPKAAPKRKPGEPTKAKQLAVIVRQMADLAASAETLAGDMLPAQIEYAFRLIWDRLDPERRAMLAAFVDKQRAKRKP